MYVGPLWQPLFPSFHRHSSIFLLFLTPRFSVLLTFFASGLLLFSRKQEPEMAFVGTSQKCTACEKTVYLVDKLTADNRVFHKSCFRCHHCKGTLKVWWSIKIESLFIRLIYTYIHTYRCSLGTTILSRESSIANHTLINSSSKLGVWTRALMVWWELVYSFLKTTFFFIFFVRFFFDP